MLDDRTKSVRNAARLSVCAAALFAVAAHAQQPPADPAPETSLAADPLEDDAIADIVVTARLRDESLMDIPVAVTALTAAEIAKYNSADLTDIGELTPTVIVGNYKLNGGGSIAIRGISSAATQVGFEQPVSVSIDGVQTSSGKVAMLGFFDLERVEILKGPQALFFGKNSPAGVISIVSAGPTSTLEIGGRVGYEFEGSEIITEGYVSGPLSDSFGARLAVKARELDGYLTNNARPIANPYFAAGGLPQGVATLPGAPDSKVGDRELMGRLTLEFEPSPDFSATAKLFAITGDDQGAGAFAQNIGPCAADGLPRSYGIADPFGDCRADDQTSFGSIPDAVAATLPRGEGDGTGRGEMTAYIASLALDYSLGNFNVASITGYLEHDYYSLSALDHTVYGGLIVLEDTNIRSFTQELRLLSDFDGPFNFLLGGYFQDAKDTLYNDTLVTPYVFFRLAGTGRYEAYEKVAALKSKTYSLFGQAIWDVTDELELAAGLRWTRERKNARTENTYGFGPFNTRNTVFAGSSDPTPGILAGNFTDSNVSPEVTLTWQPEPDLTLYAAYKTGFKSGGFSITNPIQTTSALSDIDFDSETVEGFEAGIKGYLIDRRLRYTATAFAYDFSDLQATIYDASTVRFQINNAGKVRQRGAELEFDFRASDTLSFHAAAAYVRNRISDYIGQCYGFTYAAGTNRATASPPPGCRFTNATSLTLEQDFEGRPPPRSPDFSGNFGAELDIPIASGLQFGLTGDAFYSDSYFAGDSYSPGSVQSSFWRFNASARIADAGEDWQLALIGRNLTDKHYILFAADRTGGTTLPGFGEQRGVIARGREILLQGTFRF